MFSYSNFGPIYQRLLYLFVVYLHISISMKCNLFFLNPCMLFILLLQTRIKICQTRQISENEPSKGELRVLLYCLLLFI